MGSVREMTGVWVSHSTTSTSPYPLTHHKRVVIVTVNNPKNSFMYLVVSIDALWILWSTLLLFCRITTHSIQNISHYKQTYINNKRIVSLILAKNTRIHSEECNSCIFRIRQRRPKCKAFIFTIKVNHTFYQKLGQRSAAWHFRTLWSISSNLTVQTSHSIQHPSSIQSIGELLPALSLRTITYILLAAAATLLFTWEMNLVSSINLWTLLSN